MTENPLKVIAADNSKPLPQQIRLRSARAELQAKLERMWLTDPKQFDPMRNNIERERVKRINATFSSLQAHNGPAVDLGCGFGDISRHLCESGWKVEAVDIATNALKAFAKRGNANIQLTQDTLPSTRLEDDAYALVVCTDVIGYLEARDYRLLMAELSRLVKQDGHVVCSTAIDINSEDALQRFGSLVETEFEVIEWSFSHHLLLIRLKRFFEAPHRYVKASREAACRKAELSNRSGLSHWWLKVNSSKWMGYLWTPIEWALNPIVTLLRQNRSLMIGLEHVCHFFWSESGISHAIFLGTRRPMIMPTKADLESVEPKGKKHVWE